MKRLLIIIIFILNAHIISSQEMNNTILEEIFTSLSDTLQGESGRWQFVIKDVMFICVTDINHNRMRIISPITKTKNLDEEKKTLMLLANFHTVLDVKYAISEDILWSVFLHPFRELTTTQVEDAVKQVYYANLTFGSSYTSTDLVFPGKIKEEEKEKEKNTFKKKT